MVADDIAEVERRLQEVDLLRRRVLNVVPHALRTPITTLRGLAHALDAASEDDIRTTIAPAMQRLAAQAEHLLDDMLVASGLTTTLPTTVLVATPVADTARSAWHEVAPDRPPLVISGGDECVLAPAGTLFKILVHVLDNAAKYGSGEPTMSVTRAGDRIEVVVDSPGREVLEVALFDEPFFRGEQAVVGAAGLGVGLTVARALAEHAGGSLSVAAREGGGVATTFELRSA